MKKKNYIKFIFFVTIIFYQIIFTNVFCQDIQNPIEKLFSSYQQNFVTEKIFVHTDKNFYVAGEIIWFKLYNVNATDNTPLSLSKVAYVEIIDSTNNNILKAKIALQNGEGDGSFYLPLNLNSGNYKLRAYTNWMKNLGADYFFEKNIFIINTRKELIRPAIKKSDDFTIQFFPEGGNLVNNIPSVVAFKATNIYGEGIHFTGYLLDNADTIDKFQPIHDGMGTFKFTPLANHHYTAFVKSDSGVIVTKALPTAYSIGYAMHVTDSLNKIYVSVKCNDPKQQQVYLFIHSNEVEKKFLTTALQNGAADFIIDKNILGDGISVITIFNQQKIPVCERLYFKKPAKQLKINVHTDLTVYHTRSKVNVQVGVDDTETNDSASLSMSVYKIDSLQQLNDESISSYLLLTSDLKGYIENPDYYFLNDDAKTNTALDNVMLINGWRRFKWENVLNDVKPYFEFVPEYNGLLVTGNVINIKTMMPAAGIETFISVPGYMKGFSTCTSDTAGRIQFELKNYYDSSLIVEANQKNNNDYTINVNDPFSKEFSNKPFPFFSLPKNYAATLLQHSIGMQVQNIYSKKELQHFAETQMDTSSFYTQTDAQYLLDNYKRFTTMEEVLREYVTLVDVRKRENKFHIKVFDFADHEMMKTDPLILLDGVPVIDIDKFMQVDPLKLYKLEVINRKYFLGRSVFNGIVSWTSYKKNMADYEPDGAIIDYDGLLNEREFYSPVYNSETQRQSHIPDFRNVLQWLPKIIIEPGKSKDIHFYTSDVGGKYAIVIQGLSRNGLCGNTIFFFEVKK